MLLLLGTNITAAQIYNSASPLHYRAFVKVLSQLLYYAAAVGYFLLIKAAARTPCVI